MKKYKRLILIIIGIILISTPFVIISKYNKYSDDLPCYDNKNNIISGANCSGETNSIMDTFFLPIIILTMIGCFILVVGFSNPIQKLFGDKNEKEN